MDVIFQSCREIATTRIMETIRDKILVCCFCQAEFITPSNYSRHIKMHLDPHRFSCDIPECDYTTRNRFSFLKHIDKHEGVKKLRCSECLFIAKDQAELTKHADSLHILRKFDCKKCDYKARTKSHLKIHMLSHSPIRKFQCHICDKKFTQNCNLQAHIRRHSGVKKFECSKCDYKSFQKHLLARHVKVHHGGKTSSSSSESTSPISTPHVGGTIAPGAASSSFSSLVP